MGIRVRAVVFAAVIVAFCASQPAAMAAPPAGVIGHAGRWMTDDAGRVLMIHGVNLATKWGAAYPAAFGFDDDDAALLVASGFNAVRLTVERYKVEPTPGHFDPAYVDHFGDTVAMLNRHGILSLIDFHQDEYGPVFFDNGFPDWMTLTDGLPNLYQVGFPFQYLLNPALNRAYDHLWANDVGPSGRRLQDDDADILAYVTRRLADLPGILGFEIINEPWPGTVYPTCFVPVVGCPLFDRGPYSAYNARAISAMRAADRAHLIWYEPMVNFNYGIPTSMVLPRDRRLGFSFHDYPLLCVNALCGQEDTLVMANAVAHASSTGNALLLTEFGATTDLPAYAQQLALYDEARMPWMFWSYDGFLAGPGAGPMLDTLVRPYPQLIAGTPARWTFDPASKAFTFRYSTKRADKRGPFPNGSETVISVPARQYPGGYTAAVTGGTVTSAPNAALLRVRSNGHARVVDVKVTSA